MKAYNGYSDIMFDRRKFNTTIAHLTSTMPSLMAKYDFDTIVVTGKSGCALGFALMAAVPKLHVVFVRKGESSHGDMIEGCGHEFTRWAFFDDFVSSGESYRRVDRELQNYATKRSGHARPEGVLAIEYAAKENEDKYQPAGGSCGGYGVDIPRYRMKDPDYIL